MHQWLSTHAMAAQRLRWFVPSTACALLAGACTGSVAGGKHGATDNVDGGMDGDADSGSPSAVYAIPLGTPSDSGQGLFYTAALSASGGNFLLDIDTGSTDTAIAGSDMGVGLSPVYTPGAGATNTGQTDRATYGDNSGWTGTVYTDTVGLGNGSPNVTLNLVDMTAQSAGFFRSNDYQGILGLGSDDLLGTGTTAYPDVLASAGVAKKMGFELCPTNGTLWLGGYDSSHAAADMQYTPITTGGPTGIYYSVNMTAMGYGSTDLGVTSTDLANPIVDTGTSLFYVPPAAQAALISDLNNDSAFKTLFPGQTMTAPDGGSGSGCVMAGSNVTDAMVDHMLQPLQMSFANVQISAPALSSYLADAGGGQYCLVIYQGAGLTILGDMFLRGFVTEIDLVNNQVGFAPQGHCAAPAVSFRRAVVERGHRWQGPAATQIRAR
jgi:hypothetical protein